MITCCYLGHDSAYDRDLYKRLLDAVIELTEDQPIRFLAAWRSYYSRTEEYSPQALYYRAILEVRERFPDRDITISYVLDTREESETWLPDSLDKRDTVLIIPYDYGNANPNEIGERVNRQMRLLLAQADVVLRYVYPQLQGRYSQLSKYAERRGKKFLDITNPETAKACMEYAETKLPERMRDALFLRLEGNSWSKIGERFGVGSERARQITRDGAMRLSRHFRLDLREGK